MPKRPNQIALTLPPQQRERLDTLAAESGRSVSELIRQGVQELLDRQQKALPYCSQCGKQAPVAGYCAAGPLCPDCF